MRKQPTAITESSRLAADQGVVTLRIVSLHERTLHSVKIQNLDTQQELFLVRQPALGGESYRFTGIVPAGRYKTRKPSSTKGLMPLFSSAS